MSHRDEHDERHDEQQDNSHIRRDSDGRSVEPELDIDDDTESEEMDPEALDPAEEESTLGHHEDPEPDFEDTDDPDDGIVDDSRDNHPVVEQERHRKRRDGLRV